MENNNNLMSYPSSNHRINVSLNDSPKDVRFLNLPTSPSTTSSSSSSSPSIQSYSSLQKSKQLAKFSSSSRSSPSHIPRYDNLNNGRGISSNTTYSEEMKTPPTKTTWSLSAPRPEFSSDYDHSSESISRKNGYMAGVATLGVYADVVTRIGYQPCVTEEGFWVRYCILADFNYRKSNRYYHYGYDVEDIEDPMTSKKEVLASDLRRLLSTLSRDLWLLSNQDNNKSISSNRNQRRSNLDDSNYTDDDDEDNEQPFDLPKYLKTGSRRQQQNNRSSAVLAPPMSLFAPDELQYHSIYKEERPVTIHPENVDEFLAFDFTSRCALVGLQLGRSKIFIRHDTFDQLESMRTEKIRKSATIIQSFVRCCLGLQRYNLLQRSTVRVQTVVRMFVATKKADDLRGKIVYIQKCWRSFSARKSMVEQITKNNTGATKIQRAYRRWKLTSKTSVTPALRLYAVVRIQAIIRGYVTRNRVKREKEIILLEEDDLDLKSLQMPHTLVRNESGPFSPQIRLVEPQQSTTTSLRSGPSVGTNLIIENDALLNDLFREIENENWAIVDIILNKYPELSRLVDVKSGEVVLHKLSRHSDVWPELFKVVLVLNPLALMHKDNMGALPMHHAAAFDSAVELQILYEAFNDAISSCDKMGRLPLHVAAMYDAVDSVKFLLSKYPEAAHAKIHRPASNTGGGLALHLACANNASIGVITALVAANVTSTKKPDENGDLPLHLLLRCGEMTDPAVVKNLLTCFPGVLSRTDSFGNLPLAIAIKSQCPYVVVNTLLTHYPEAARILNADQQSPLVLAFQNQAEDRTIIALLNHAPELATAVDIRTGLLPIQIATEHEQSTFIVHHLLKRDLPIDLNEKVRARLIPHHFSWNHVVSNTDDLYHQVVSQVLRACTQPQVLALAHIEGPDGRTALAAATVICKYEIRVMLRLFNTLEVMHERAAYTNSENDTQIFYALRFEPPPQQNVTFNVLHEAVKKGGADDYLEDYDDQSHVSAMSRGSIKSTLTSRTQQTVEDRLRHIRNEKGEHVIVKLTSRASLVERELKVRKDYQLSRHYIPAVLSVHHTVQHAAYYDAMAESGFCITMEGADATAENQKEALMKSDRRVLAKALKRIGISLLHMHEHGLVHGDFAAHNIGSFGSRWKLLSVGGSVPIGGRTDPSRGLYPPPEAIFVENKRIPLGKKHGTASVVSVPADPSFDVWAYGVLVFELVVGSPLSPYANRGKSPLTQVELHRLAQWDDNYLRKEIMDIQEDDPAIDLLRKLLHSNPRMRFRSMRNVLDHPFFTGAKSPKRADHGIDELPTPPRNQSLPTQISVQNYVQEEINQQNTNNKKSSTIRGGFKKLRSSLKKSDNQGQTRIYI